MNPPIPEPQSPLKERSARSKRGRTMLVVAAAMAGAAIGGATIAGPATSSSSASTSVSTPASTPGQRPANAPDPAKASHGPGETLLTGTTADKVKAAALAAVPNSTVIRVETDSAGSPYEAHLQKSDGTQVTVKVDANFKVTGTEQGFGPGPGGHMTPNGGPPPDGSQAPNGSQAPSGSAQ